MASWRDTYKPARFFMLDARLAYVLLPALLHIRWWTLAALVIVAGVMFHVERRRGLHLEAAFRFLRRSLAGPLRPARNPVRRRGLADYG